MRSLMLAVTVAYAVGRGIGDAVARRLTRPR